MLVFLKRRKQLIEIKRSRLAIDLLIVLIGWLYLMTGSRGGLLALAGLIVIPVLLSTNKDKIFRIIGLLLLVIGIVYVIAPIVLPDNIYLRLFTSGSYIDTIDSTKNRVAIWQYSWNSLLPEFKLMGFGSGLPKYMIGPYFGFAYRSLHNTYLTMIFEYGIIGLPIFISLLFILIKDAGKRKDSYSLGAMIGICFIIFFLDGYPRTYMWNILTYCGIHYLN
jgi:O-antigen ligase